MSDWQPIETKPKYGIAVILYAPDEGFVSRCPHDRIWGDMWLGKKLGWLNGPHDERKPTHWMPLPTPPTGSHR